MIYGQSELSYNHNNVSKYLFIADVTIRRRLFVTKGDESGEWRRFLKEELHSLYHSPNIVRFIKSRRLRWAGHLARMEECRSAFEILTGKPTGKRPLGRPTSR